MNYYCENYALNRLNVTFELNCENAVSVKNAQQLFEKFILETN